MSRTNIDKHTSFVCDKNDTLTVLKEIFFSRTQWANYMETIVYIITINSQNETYIHRVMTQETYQFRICQVTLPQCRTDFIYILMSLQRPMIYIGQTVYLRQRIQDHNSENGPNTTQPEYPRPFILMNYICGFGGGCK